MTKRLEIYKCNVCGNIVMVLHPGKGELVCCKQPMELLKENTVDAAHEKHIPVIQKTDSGYQVKVGSVSHPMTEKHYIEWIEFQIDSQSCIRFLNPGDEPSATFEIKGEKVSARAYCNLHGLWKAD